MIDYRTAKGWLTERERQFLYDRAREAPQGGRILNIGTEYGASVHCLFAGSEGTDVTILGVDIDTSKMEGMDYINRRVVLGEIDSRAFVDSALEAQRTDQYTPRYELVFVDADHTRAMVLSDARISAVIPIGGVIAFHDCYDLALGKPHPHPWNPDGNDGVQEWWEAHKEEWEEGETVDSIRWFRRVA